MLFSVGFLLLYGLAMVALLNKIDRIDKKREIKYREIKKKETIKCPYCR